MDEDKYSKEQLNGIDLAIKITAKSYPFIIGWNITKHEFTFIYSFYVDLVVDLEKASEFYEDYKIGQYWLDKFKNGELIEVAYITSMGDTEPGVGPQDKKLLENDINFNYSNLPEKYKGKKIEVMDDVDIRINNYVCNTKTYFEA